MIAFQNIKHYNTTFTNAEVAHMFNNKTATLKAMDKLIWHSSKRMNRKTPCQSNKCTVFTSLQNLHHKSCIFATVLEVWRFPYSKTTFQQFLNNARQFQGLPHWSHVTGLASDPLWPEQRGHGRDGRANWEKVSSCSSKSPAYREKQYGPCMVMLQDDPLLPRIFARECTVELLECL